MVESKSDFSSPTPSELQFQLRGIFSQLPRNSPNSKEPREAIDDMFEDAARRFSSEHKATLKSQLNRVLGFSLATPTFTRMISLTFDEAYNIGFLEGEFGALAVHLQVYDLQRFLGTDETPLGIFELESAKDIERREFKRRLGWELEWEMNNPDIEDVDYSKWIFGEIEKWRQEFVKHYGEEP